MDKCIALFRGRTKKQRVRSHDLLSPPRRPGPRFPNFSSLHTRHTANSRRRIRSSPNPSSSPSPTNIHPTVTAQTAGTPSLLSLSPSFSYLENNVSLPITTGILSQPITIDLNRSLIDTTQCATFTELSCASNKIPYVIHTRMLFSGDGGMIEAVQSVVAKEGDWAFDAKAQLKCRCRFLFLLWNVSCGGRCSLQNISPRAMHDDCN